jgi:hypothetical protein
MIVAGLYTYAMDIVPNAYAESISNPFTKFALAPIEQSYI